MSKTYKYHFIALLLSLLTGILSISYLLFENTSIIVEHRDVIIPPFPQLILQYFFTWSNYGSYQFYEGIARLWLATIPSLSSKIEISSRLYCIFYFICIFLIPYLSLFYLIENLFGFDNKNIFLLSIVFAFLFSINPYTIQAFSPPNTYVISYSLLPTIIVATLYFLRSKNLKSKLFLCLLITLSITPIFRYIIFIFILLSITTSLYIIFYGGTISFLKEIIKKYIFISIFLLLFNFYWFLPAIGPISKISPSYMLSYEATYMFSSAYKPADILTLKASWWPYLQLKPFPFIPESIFNIILFLIPILAMVSILLFNRYSREEKFLVVVGSSNLLLGIFLWRGITNFNPIFSRFYEFLLFSTHPSIGWMFRVPGYFGSLVVLGYSLCIFSLLSWIFRMRKFKKIGIILCIIIILSSLIIGWQRFTGDLDGILRKGYYFEDREHYDRAPYNKSIVLLSNYQGNFKAHHTGKPYINLPNDLSRYLKHSFKKGDEKTIYYISYLTGADALITNLEIENPKIYYIYPESKEGINIYLPERDEIKNIYIKNKIASSKDFDYKLLGSLSLLNNSLSVLTGMNENEATELEINPDFYSNIFSKNSFLIKTFDSTYRHNPSKLWSRASTSDPLHGGWHPYLEQFGIENWQSDYGEGLVFTWAPSKLKEKIVPTDDDLIYNFDSKFLQNFTNLSPLVLNITSSTKSKDDNYSLQVEIKKGDEWGWKVISTDYLPIKPDNWYQCKVLISGKDSKGVHSKIIYFNEKKEEIKVDFVFITQDETFDWKEFSSTILIPSDSKYIKIQFWVWQNNQTNSYYWLDYVKLYDLSKFTESNDLEINFKLEKTENYHLLIRYFKNQKGGSIKIFLDNKEISLNTLEQLNKFVWGDLGEFYLEKGKHKLILRNIKGFNAINLFALVTSDELARKEKEVEEMLRNKTIIYLFEGESDFYRENAEKEKYGKASNGEFLVITPSGKAWREFEFVKNGFYRFAINLYGALKIRIDNQSFSITSNNFTYFGPIYLEKGPHKIQIEPDTTLQPFTWNFYEEEVEEWKQYTKESQIYKVFWDEKEKALRTELYNSTWGWKTINSPLIPAKYGVKYKFDFFVKAVNGQSVHFKIFEYNSSKQYIGGVYAGGIGEGTFDWKEINYEYKPKNTSVAYIQLQIWHGHETKQPIPNIVWVKNVTIYGYPLTYLDVAWIYSVESNTSDEKIEDLFKVNETPAQVLSYQKIDPTLWKVQVNASKPFMLSFAESYDPLWVARIKENGKTVEYHSIPLYGVINGFWINKTGEYEIEIRYKPQEWFEIGLVISGITFIACIGYLIYDWKKGKNISFKKLFLPKILKKRSKKWAL